METSDIDELKIRMAVMERMLIILYAVDSMVHDVDQNVMREAIIEEVFGIVTKLPESQEALWVEARYVQQVDRIFGLIQQTLHPLAKRRGQ